MKRVVVRIAVILAAGIGYASWQFSHSKEDRSPGGPATVETTEWVPTEAELRNGNQGAGWVFGRMIGLADAPGSPNHSPFGKGGQLAASGGSMPLGN